MGAQTPCAQTPSPVICICSLSFHLTEGQRVEACWPEGSLQDSEMRSVAFHAFPDSMSFELHTHSSVRDSTFFFRIRRAPSSAASPSFLYGHVFCRQRQDERLQRGGEQRAVVVLSALPLGAVLSALSKYAGPLCIARGPEALKQVYSEVQQWPQLEWGSTMALPLGIGSIHVDLPELSMLPPEAAAAAAALQGAEAVAAALTDELDDGTGLPLCLLPQSYGQLAPACGMFSDADVYTPLRPLLPHLWALWELMLLGEPLMIFSPTPTACSAAVAALTSLLAPFPYAPDFRPYYTIHDASFASLAAGAMPGPATSFPHPSLLGVTNPFFLKALAHWPNVVSTGYTPATQPEGSPRSSSEEESGGSIPGQARALQPAASLDGRGAAPLLGGLLRRRPPGAQSLLTHPTDAAWLSYVPCAKGDRDVLGSLLHPRPSEPPDKRRRLAQLNAAILRRHFEELTRAVLVPLLPFVSPTPPPAAPTSPQELRNPPPLPPFDPGSVLEGLAAKGSHIPETLARRFPGKLLPRFYGRLLVSPALSAWLAARRSAAELWQQRAWRAAWHAAGGAWLLPGVSHTDEVAMVEQLFVLEVQARAAAALGGGEAAAERLRAAFKQLPGDLRSSLLLSPGRAELLQGGEGTGGDPAARKGAADSSAPWA